MPLTISDEILASAHLTDREALIEFACTLFVRRKLHKPQAAKLCGLTRTEFEQELINRDLPVVIYNEELVRQDGEAATQLAEMNRAGR